uniref:Uncharacterized protein n=1 Tax=Faecalibaculum rodentium TaxID=1702221 RepID=A0A140DYJ2_9FIRM|nr:hypothetical protein AALO17_25850 [Faecalibaculum rodentium]
MPPSIGMELTGNASCRHRHETGERTPRRPLPSSAGNRSAV